MIPLLITIDVEGDNLWAKPGQVETKNAAFLPRFQALCERYRLKPTYLTDYEMAIDAAYVAFARDVLARGTAEIGMHLHAWNTPPLIPLTDDDTSSAPYLIDYPQPVQRKKIGFMTRLLEDTFGMAMRSHRAGRWAFNEAYASALVAAGYEVDCSVTPLVDWRRPSGGRRAGGGVDYRAYPARHYWMSTQNISVAGDSPLLEVPVTIVNGAPPMLRDFIWNQSTPATVAKRALRRLWPMQWMRPNGSNLSAMCAILELGRREKWPQVEFMLHSSELMPGGSPAFPTADSIETLYDDLDALFADASTGYVGKTLSEFRNDVVNATS